MLNRLRQSLSKTTAAVGGALGGLFSRKLDEAVLQEIEDALVSTDFGVETSAQVISLLRDRCHKAGRAGAEQWPQQLQALLTDLVQPYVGSLAIPASPRPYCILVVGVNGSGKTTTLAKLAHHYQASGHKPLLVAGDTFRAAAVEQLGSWAQRLNCPIITGANGSDPAALAYQAWQQAAQQGNDVLLIDTAGVDHSAHESRERIMHSIKRHSARECNRLLGRTGRFWQAESYDRLVRNDDERQRIARYIEWNPVKAGLCDEPERWRFSSAHRAGGHKVGAGA
jgi:signal recognition particle GTPase